MSVLAIVPARGGSKGVRGKNLRPFNGVPLVERAVQAARAAPSVVRVAVSSDDLRILELAARAGAETVRRPAALASDRASSEAALLHALEVLADAGDMPEILAFLQCTSPFTRGCDVEAVLAPLREGACDSAFSAVRDHGFLWTLDAEGRARGINHDAGRPRQLRQDLPPQFRETGAVYTMRTTTFRSVGSRFCGRCCPVVVDRPHLEIDDEQDWRYAEAIARTLDREWQ